jgi:hypothetical protein
MIIVDEQKEQNKSNGCAEINRADAIDNVQQLYIE